MRFVWKLIELAIDVAVPFVAIWLVYSVFIRPEFVNTTFVTVASVFLVTHFMIPNYQVVGGKQTMK